MNIDVRWSQLAGKWKQLGKPVIVGEQGNTGMNWDPGSAVRMRIRAWTALFQEISLIFWNTSWRKAGMFGGHYTPGTAANIYLGPEERDYVRALQKFASRLDGGIRMVQVSLSPPEVVRGYGLVSKNMAAFYLHHAANHTTLLENAKVGFDFSGLGQQQLIGEWIDPATGSVVSRVSFSPRLTELQVPPFKIDLALLVSSSRQRGQKQR